MSFDLINWLERKILLSTNNEDARTFNETLIKKRINYIKSRDKYDSLQTLNT